MGDAEDRPFLIFNFLPAKSVKINLNKIEGADLKKSARFLSARQGFAQMGSSRDHPGNEFILLYYFG